MMLVKKNSEALENFSEKLDVEGRSNQQPGCAGADHLVCDCGTLAVAIRL